MLTIRERVPGRFIRANHRGCQLVPIYLRSSDTYTNPYSRIIYWSEGKTLIFFNNPENIRDQWNTEWEGLTNVRPRNRLSSDLSFFMGAKVPPAPGC